MKEQISSPNDVFPSKLPKVPPAARSGLSSDPCAAWISPAPGQKQPHGTALPPASVPKGGLVTDPEPRPRWVSVPSSPDLHVPTGTGPWIIVLISALTTLQFTSTNNTAPLLTSLGLLRTLKGTQPRDSWGQAARCRAGGDGSVRGAHLQRYPWSRNPAANGPKGSRETAPQNPKGEENTPGASPTCCPSIAWSRLLPPAVWSTDGDTAHRGVASSVAGSMGWMTMLSCR